MTESPLLTAELADMYLSKLLQTADEIKRLRVDIETYIRLNGEQLAEIARLRTALENIADGTWNNGQPFGYDLRAYALRALEQAGKG